MSDNLPPEELVKALRAVADAWSAHAEAVERVNAAIPDLEATRAERAVYDERYRASEQRKREMYGAAFEFAKWCAETDAAALIERLEARDKEARTVLRDIANAVRLGAATDVTAWRNLANACQQTASKYLAQGEG